MKIPMYKQKIPVSTVVDLYSANNKRNRQDHLQFYKEQESLEKNIEISSLSRDMNGKRHPHQRRIPKEALPSASEKLLKAKNQLERCKDFDDLISLIENLIGDIVGIGELTIYDIANRIGSKLGLRPEYIYLHSGTRTGARKLLPGNKKSKLSHKDLPSAFKKLTPDEVEDCLCVYKDRF